MRGFEILFATIGSALKSKNDLVVSVIHWHCIQKGFLCVGIGENWSETAETGSELLPQDWNRSDDTYILRYVDQKSEKKLLIKCVKNGDIFIVSALILDDHKASTLTIKADEYITNDFKTLNRAFISGSIDSLSQIIEKEIINPITTTPSPSRSSQTEDTRNRREQNPEGEDPLRVGPARVPYPYGEAGTGQPFYGGQWPPPYGGADLDPLGRAQGGMIMDPRNFPAPFGGLPRNPRGGLPPGAVPPGARFDPFGPPGVGPNPRPQRNPRHMGPDPDHLPPPGYDDMFM